jgi:8-oxo-dGTP diphosphatase
MTVSVTTVSLEVPRPHLNVCVGILRDVQGRVLLASRPEGKPYAGYWEFPGGKIEAGETPLDALIRELHEELGIQVTTAYRWVTRYFEYPHATVQLHFFWIPAWDGEPTAQEGQQLSWQSLGDVTCAPILSATVPLLPRLALPQTYVISNASQMGVAAWLDWFDLYSHQIQLLQLREKTMTEPEFAVLFEAVRQRCQAQGITLLVNSYHPARYWQQADGVHLTTADLMRYDSLDRTQLPRYVFASCHTAAEIHHAFRLDVDAIVVGTVHPSASHPQGATLGWDGFSDLLAEATNDTNHVSSCPVYAIGGMQPCDLPIAWQHGAWGIAGIRQVIA